VRPYRDDDNEQVRRGWQRRWQDEHQPGARPRRAQGYADDREPGDRYGYAGERYGYTGERERFGNPLERYPYEEPWRAPGPYRLRRPGYDEEGYRVPGDEAYAGSELGPVRRSSREREDDLSRGPYRGRGPKGYRRSDESLRDDVCQRLQEHGQIDASEIEVSCKEGVVTLRGSVDERPTKRLAEDIAECVTGVTDVENHLRVDRGFFEQESGRSRSAESRKA